MLQNFIHAHIISYYLCRNSPRYGIRRYIFSHNSPGSHRSSSPDCDTALQCHPASNPYIIFHYHRLIIAFWFGGICNLRTEKSQNTSMIARMHRQFLCYATVGLDCKRRVHRAYPTIGHYGSVFIQKHIFRLIKISRRSNPYALCTVAKLSPRDSKILMPQHPQPAQKSIFPYPLLQTVSHISFSRFHTTGIA